MNIVILALAQLAAAHAELPLEDGRWLPVQQLGTAIVDASDEDLTNDQLDLVGDVEHPTGQWWLDDDHLYVRMRLATSPVHPTISGALADGGWGLLVDTDSIRADYEHFVIVENNGTTLTIGQSTTELPATWSSPPGEPLVEFDSLGTSTMTLVSDADSALGGTENGFLDIAVPRTHIGLLGPSDTIRIAMATDSFRLTPGFEYDLAGSAPTPSLESAFSDPIGEDPDEDGLGLIAERLIGTDPQAADSDGDGYTDGEEYLEFETDPLDPLDPDPSIDFDCDGEPDEIAEVSVDMDSDPDGDGLSTAEELVCESDPCTPDLDVDGDGIPNDDEAACGGDPCVAEIDIDGDGIATAEELIAGTDPCTPTSVDDTGISSDTGSSDTGVSDTGEPDSGEPTAVDPTADEDCDGVLDFEDDEIAFDDEADNDGDGIANGQEINDCQTDPCTYDIDPDRDGIQNDREAQCETDPCSPDSDADGLWDNQELSNEGCGPDTDGDGTIDALDPDDSQASDPIRPEMGNHGFVGGDFTGGGCSHSPSAPLWTWTILFAVVLLLRQSGPGLLLLLLIPTFQVANAQTINANQLTPSTTSKSFVVLDDPVQTKNGFVSNLLFHYAKSPLLYRYRSGSAPPVQVVSDLWTTDLSIGYRHHGWDISARMPMHPYATGNGLQRWGAMGDTTISVHHRLLSRLENTVGLAMSGHITAPTGDRVHWLSDGPVSGAAMVHMSTGPSTVFASRLGMKVGSPQTLGTLTTRPQLLWAVGANIPMAEAWSSSLELTGFHHLSSLKTTGAHPMEVLGTGRYRLTPQWQISAGAATAVSRGVGTPAFRVLMGVQYGPEHSPSDPQLSGSDAPTGTLHLSVTDNGDQPVQTTAILVESAVSIQTDIEGQSSIDLLEGTHTLRINKSGFAPIQRVVEIRSSQNIQLAIVLSPTPSEPQGNGPFVEDRIPFEPGSADIIRSATAILDEVAMVLLDDENLRIVEIQGHCDRSGTEDENHELSVARANAVLRYLVEAGVNESRLRAKGYGASLPLSTEKTDAGTAKNRRVEFYVLERSVP